MDQQFPPGMLDDIQQFLSTDATRPPGQDLYPEVFASRLFFPLQRQAELRKMIRLARWYNPTVVMEIGTDKGGGLYHWLKCLPTVKVAIACEIRDTPYWRLFNNAFPTVEFLWLGGVSSYAPTTVSRVSRWLNKQTIDVLFIDGDKAAFARDFDSYRPYLSRQAIVFMHDVQDQGPMRDAWLRCRWQGEWHEEILDVSDYEEARRREKEGIPSANAHEGWLRYWKGRSCGVGVIGFGKRPEVHPNSEVNNA